MFIVHYAEQFNILVWCVCVCVAIRSCIASRDPYCGWKPHGVCERIQPGVMWVQTSAVTEIIKWNLEVFWDSRLICIASLLSSRTEYEQDIELGNTAHLGDCHGMNLISMSCHWFWDTHMHIHTDTRTLSHRRVHMKHSLISTHTMSLHTHSSNHSSNFPLHKSMWSINTHICIQYMATCNLCRLWGRNMDMYN